MPMARVAKRCSAVAPGAFVLGHLRGIWSEPREGGSLLVQALKKQAGAAREKQGRSACSAFLIVGAPRVKNTDTARQKSDDSGKNASDIKRQFVNERIAIALGEAAQLMPDAYQAQIGREALHVPRNASEPLLWREFQAYRAEQNECNYAAWVEQRRPGRARRSAMRSIFYAARGTTPAGPWRSHAERKSAMNCLWRV